MIPFLPVILSFLQRPSPKTWLYIGAGLLAAIVLWKAYSFVSAKYELEAKVIEQALIIQHQEEELATQETLRVAAEEAAKIARAEALNAQRRAEEFAGAKTRIIMAPASDDGPVAPVLEQALDAIRNRLMEDVSK